MGRTSLISGNAAVLLVAALCLPAGGTHGSERRVELYPPVPGAANAERLTAMLEGQALPLAQERVWHADSGGQYYIELAVARFAADGPVRMELATDQGEWGQPALRELGRDLAATVSGSKVALQLPGPGQYYLQAPALARPNSTFTVVFWVDDLRAVEQTRAQFKSAVDATRKGVRSDPMLDQTAAIQRLLDQGGRICFPAGVYRAGSLSLRSDTILYLAPGAVLQAIDAEDGLGSEFIAIEQARNVTICGQGTLDAHSLSIRRRHNVHHLNITSSRAVTCEDVLLKDSNSWAVHIRRSDHFRARNVKVLSGKDGFDPDASRDVAIEGAFVVSGDDAIAIKNRFPTEPDGRTTERVVVRDCILCSLKSALKIGTETRGPIRDVSFEHCDVFDGERGIVLYARDGGPIERAQWRNLRLFMRNWPQEKESGTVFHLNIERREALTPVRECRIENVTANWLAASKFAGVPGAPLQGVTLRNITLRVEPPKSGNPCLFETQGQVQVSAAGLTIDWDGNKAKWAGIASGAGLTVTEAHERN